MARSQQSRARLRATSSLWALLFAGVVLTNAAEAHDSVPAVQLPIIPPPVPLNEPELSSEPHEFVSDRQAAFPQFHG